MFDVFYKGIKPNLFAFEKPAEDLDDAAGQSKTSHYWFIYSGNDYASFNFDYVPLPWQKDFVHVWPSQWQRNGEVYLANKHTVRDRQWHFMNDQSVVRLPDETNWIIPSNIDKTSFDFSWHPDSLEPPYEYHFPTQHQRDGGPIYKGNAGIKYVNAQKIRANATQIFYMDFLNPESDAQFELLQKEFPDLKRTRYVDNHLNVFKRIMNMATAEFVWIISSICMYDFFDFTWHPPEEQREMIHCFSSHGQKRGDTFRIHVPSFSRQMVELELLDWFNVINYVEGHSVERYPAPIHIYSGDDLVSEIKKYNFKTPYVTFTNQKDLSLLSTYCLWGKKDRTVVRATKSGATCIVPRDIKEYLKTQIYDYPYLDKTFFINEYYDNKSYPGIDIVYISNGEPDEEKWYDTLCYVSNNTGSEIKWIRGVNGRTAAYQAAARASTTPWFFAVFAKIEVDVHFPWREWMPDYWQEPKHYIFNAHNPVNGLEYGHQGIIAYNKKLVLENNSPGIDFTLSQPHESVPILSGTAHFNQDPWMTWRTAFREVIKLKHFDATAPTLENSHRLDVWCTQAEGNYAEYCLQGAQDAVAYYNEVDGDYEKLKLSFEWEWLRERFNGNTL